MSKNFYRVIKDTIGFLLQKHGFDLNAEETERLRRIQRGWNFYEGFHWEEVEDTGSPQVTVNYCKRFINKLVSFEVGKGFTIKMKPEIEKIDNENDPLDFLNDIWKYNKKDEKLLEFGQSKAVTGDAWIQLSFIPPTLNDRPNPAFDDPFEEYPKGKIKITVVASSICFPEYDEYDKDMLKKFNVIYPVADGISGNPATLFRQEWTKEKVSEYKGKQLLQSIPNRYGFIPFVHIKNYPLQGKNYGLSDIDDMIPINAEINLKKSNISEIIDYHSAPITLVFGARIHNLERGANKVWGGLPKDAKVENLKMEGELDAAQKYVDDLKSELLIVTGIPVASLGGELSISNTSGVALHIALMPLLEKIEAKHKIDAIGLSLVNKYILKIALKEKLISIPSGIKPKDFYDNEIEFDSMLPRDIMAELQQIDAERKMLLITRKEALTRLKKDNIEKTLDDIDQELKDCPEFYIENLANKEGKDKQINAGLLNSPEPKPSISKK